MPPASAPSTSSAIRAAFLLVVACVLAGCAGPSPEPGRTGATVARVGDGDTLDVREGRARVRLVQIDAPELGEGECYARQAHDELERLARPGSRVELEPESRLGDSDRFGRLLRYVHAGGLNVNVELVRRGAAAPFFLGGEQGRYAAALLDAVDEARAARRGLWGACRVEWSPRRPVVTRPR